MQTGIVHKLLKRPLAAIAIGIIVCTTLISALAYVLAPDNTPNANTQIVELGAKPPGFSSLFLLIPKAQQPVPAGTLTAWLSGRPSAVNYIPINDYIIKGDTLSVRHYIDDGKEDTLRYSLAQLVPRGKAPDHATGRKSYIIHHSLVKRTFYLGTDRYGRDILSRLLIGSRVSISVGFVAVILSLTIGIILGSAAGYFGGRVDNAVMFLINILWSIPTLLLVFAITLTIGKGFWEIFAAIGLTMWVGAARLIRGQVMVLREMEYITAAKTLGISDVRIIYRHILPNIAGPIMVIAASNFAAAILTEAGLSFLGIGVQPPQPSWGLMIKEHYNFLLAGKPFAALIPGLAIMLLVYAFNILGNALRDILDVKG